MSPELFQGGKPGVQSDLYALGLIAYEIFTGSYPFPSNNIGTLIAAILHNTPDFQQIEDASIAMWLDCLLSKHPEERYQSAEKALEAFCDAVGFPMPPEGQLVRESLLQAAKFVGRNHQMTILQSELKASLQGGTAFYLLGGESGVGKSRLLEELQSRALVEGCLLLKGQAVSAGGLPYHLWRPVFRSLILHLELSNAEASILKELVPDIETILGRAVENFPKSEAGSYQERLSKLTIDMFKRSSVPILLILEDLQWSAESLVLIQALLKAREELSHVLLLASYRDDERPELVEFLQGCKILSLKRLEKTAIAELSVSILGELGNAPAILDFLLRESEGNAFFILEAIRSLAENLERLSEIEQDSIPEHILTSNMKEILQRRLSKVPQEYLDLQNLSAVIGKQIDEKLLLQIMPEANLEDWLYLGEELSLFEVNENHWHFSHDKLREIILANLSSEQLRNFSRQVAEAIEVVYPNDKDYYELLLEHWHTAGDLDKEIYYLEVFVEKFFDLRLNMKLAKQLLDRSLKQLPENDWRRYSLLDFYGLACWRESRFEEAEPIFRSSYQLAKLHNKTSYMAISISNLGLLASSRHLYEQSETYYNESLALLEELEDTKNIALINFSMSRMNLFRGDYHLAQAHSSKAARMYREQNNLQGLGASLVGLGFAQVLSQSTDDIPQSLFEATGIAHQIRDIPAMIMAIAAYAHIRLRRGESVLSAQLIGFIKSFIYTEPLLELLSKNLIPHLQEHLNPSELEAEMEKGRRLDLDSVINEILAEAENG